MTTAAAAAPADSQPFPADAETVAVQPTIDLPRADGEVIYVNYDSYGSVEWPGTTFTYVVVNHGPERAAFEFHPYVTYKECQNCATKMVTKKQTVTLDSGANASVTIAAPCHPSAQNRPCLATGAELKTRGLDPNLSNNTDSVSL